MEVLLSSLDGWTAWLLRASLQASVVIGLVLLAQWLFKKRLSPRWRYCLWSLVLVRLMLPVSPESAFSIFNYAKQVKLLALGSDTSEVPLTGWTGPHAPSASQVAPNPISPE